MRMLRSVVPAVVLVIAGPAGAGDPKVLVPGDPPLTQDMADDYARLAEFRLGPAFDRIGRDRLTQLLVNDWKAGDNARRRAILADLTWWRDEFPKLARADRERLAARQAAQTADAIRLFQLQQWNDARQQQIGALSNLQARHHELMMQIIANMRPSGRYVYNPSSGKYDRWVSD
ncbi:MAG TPA: hypothetical protein VM597_36655 [Gemmataceae bacterium]|jgi:hypothetical protein|nr:hypothetical protein [Gemmataceae bacterium]